MRTRRALAAAALLVLAGCRWDPYGWRYTHSRPREADLAGTYAPTDKTRRMIREDGHYPDLPSRVVLDAAGNAELQNLPDWWLDGFGDSHGRMQSASATWELEQNGGDWVIGLDVPAGSGMGPQGDGGFATQIFLTGQSPPYTLHFILGDPDTGEAMEYERTSPPSRQ